MSTITIEQQNAIRDYLLRLLQPGADAGWFGEEWSTMCACDQAANAAAEYANANANAAAATAIAAIAAATAATANAAAIAANGNAAAANATAYNFAANAVWNQIDPIGRLRTLISVTNEILK